MASFSQSDVKYLAVGGAATKTTGNVGTLNDGEIGLFTPGGTRLTEASAATATSFIIAHKVAGRDVQIYGPINKGDIDYAKRTEYVASSEQVDTLGFDGTSGAIVVANDNDYHIRLNLDESRVSNHGGLYLKHAYYTSDTSATQFEIAGNLLEGLITEIVKEADDIYVPVMLINNAGAAIGGTETISYVKGSKYVLSSGTSHGVVAGDALRIGTAVTDPCYTVESVNGAEIKLVQAVRQADATGAAAEVIVAATAATADCGIKITGVAPTHRVGKLHNDLKPVRWSMTTEGFGATPIVSTAANPGVGTEKQVQEMEWFFQGNEGEPHRVGEPNLFERRAVASGNYDLINISVNGLMKTSIVSGPIRREYVLAIPATAPNYAIAGTADDITDVLEVLCAGAGVASGDFAVS